LPYLFYLLFKSDRKFSTEEVGKAVTVLYL